MRTYLSQVLALANAVGAATAMGTGAGRNVASPSLVMELLRREVCSAQHSSGGCGSLLGRSRCAPSMNHGAAGRCSRPRKVVLVLLISCRGSPCSVDALRASGSRSAAPGGRTPVLCLWG